MDRVEVCSYCKGTYPHQGPTGCWLTKMMQPLSTNSDPYIIWPYTIGRDKGPLLDGNLVLAFFSQGHAWRHIFNVVQPNDERTCTNYRVMRISEYLRANA